MNEEITIQDTRGVELKRTEVVRDPKPVDVSAYKLEIDTSVPFIAVVWMEADKIMQKTIKYSSVLIALISLFTSLTKGVVMDVKPWYASKTIIGGILTFVVALLQTFQVIPTDAVNAAELTDKIVAIVAYGVDLVGFVMVIFGRVTATKKISG